MRKNILRKLIGIISLLMVWPALIIIVACAPASSAPASEPAKKPIVLTATHHHPPPGAFHKAIMEPWAKMVEEASGGRLKVDVYPAGTFFAPPDAYQGVMDGLADISLVFPGFTPDLFPCLDVIAQTGTPYSIDGPISSFVTQRLWEEGYFAQWFKDVKLLWFFATVNAGHIILTKSVHTLDKLKGLNIRVGSNLQGNFIKALGANPVHMSTADVYIGLEKGIVDGCTFPYEAVVAFKFHEVANHSITENLMQQSYFVVMNKEKFASLPPDLQKVIEDKSGMFGTLFAAEAMTPYDPAARELLRAKEHEFIDLSPQDKATWKQAADSVKKRWLKDVAKKGVNGQELLDAATKFSAEYKRKFQ